MRVSCAATAPRANASVTARTPYSLLFATRGGATPDSGSGGTEGLTRCPPTPKRRGGYGSDDQARTKPWRIDANETVAAVKQEGQRV
jgi:hypothetical protein